MSASFDPYASCPGGCGKKAKWCESDTIEELAAVADLVQHEQYDQALRTVDKLIGKRPHNDCIGAHLACVHAQLLMSNRRYEEGFASLEETIERYPNQFTPHEAKANFMVLFDSLPEALEEYRTALSLCPADSKERLAALHGKMGECQLSLGRPLAAWAEWRTALKVQPGFIVADQAIDRFIKQNHLLSNQVRLGLPLRSPDELALFNDQRRIKWEEALKADEAWHVDDLVMAFEYLAHDDKNDSAAWYNLGLAYAWRGDNVRSLEAFDHYLTLEKNPEVGAEVVDLCELLRIAPELLSESDFANYAVAYQVVNPEVFIDRFQKSRQIFAIPTQNGGQIIHLLDKEMTQGDGAVPILGGPPRQIAMLIPGQDFLQLVSSSEDKLAKAKAEIEKIGGDALKRDAEGPVWGGIESLDDEPFLVVPQPGLSDEQRNANLLTAIQRYFEEEWIQRPLKSLRGLSPLDASQSSAAKVRIDGVLRFRERSFARYQTPYNFDRLRNKLGLATVSEGEVAERPADDSATTVSALSTQQLAGLEPSSLDDDGLAAAYRSALSLGIPQTAVKFAKELASRGAYSDDVDVAGLYRRLIHDALDHKRVAEAKEWLEKGQSIVAGYPELAVVLDAEGARVHLLDGDVDTALASYERLLDAHPDKLEPIARGVESMLSRGAFAAAQTLAEKGLAQAEEQRSRDYQSQFKEYLKEASARAK